MVEPTLQIILPALVLILFILVFFRSSFRKRKLVVQSGSYNDSLHNEFVKMKKADLLFKIIFLLFALMIVVYSSFPQFYFIFVPFDLFNHPVINIAGLLILKASIIWLVFAQIRIDKEFFKHSKDLSNLSSFELFIYSQKQLLIGLVVMFIGMFVTITNLIGILMGIMAFVLYIKLVK